MHQVKLAQHIAFIATVATLLAGTAAAHAEERPSPGPVGASLTGLTPSVGGRVSTPSGPAGTPVAPPAVPAPTSPTPPAVPAPTSPTPPALPLPVPPAPPAGPISTGPAAIPPQDPPPPTDPGPSPAPVPPAASNSTTQTITQVQVSTCVTQCDGGSQVQQASQDNTTVQAVSGPPLRDGGSPVGLPPPSTTRTSAAKGGVSAANRGASTTHGRASPAPSAAPSPPPPGVTQVQVGCIAHCHGTTTLDTSGLTLAQIEQLLNELHLPAPPVASATPAGVQHRTQQTATQSQTGDGRQSQVASQTNRTVQVVAAPEGTPADARTGPGAGAGTGTAVVNQTAQGVIQLQVGCIFYCSQTRQTQQADQSTATVQSLSGPAASAANGVSRVVYQLQVGCIAWCHDTVETQTATGTDSTVVEVPPPADPAARVIATPAPPAASEPPLAQPPAGGRPRSSGGAAVRTAGRGLGVVVPRASRLVLVSVATSRILQAELLQRRSHRVARRGHRAGLDHATPGPSRATQLAVAVAVAVPGMEPGTATAQATSELWMLLALAALGIGIWRSVR